MIGSSLSFSLPNVSAAEDNANKEYELYPSPQHVEYNDGDLSLDQDIQVVYDDTIDDATKDKVKEIFKDNSMEEPEVSNQLNNDKVNVLVGTDGSNGPVDEYTDNELDISNTDFEQKDAYQLTVDENNITVLGKDTDAAFHGLASLDSILEQSNDDAIQNMEINDYANTKLRGFIEGYYGIPWSFEDRKSLMEFGSDFKANTYIYAPKDDPYHRDKWEELYPEEDLEQIGELAEIGKETKTNFVWTISPLGEAAQTAQENGDDAAMDMLDDNTEKLLDKLDQLYDAGVREFGVLGDDVGALPLDYVVELMDSVSDWADEKGDVKDIIYTPAAYNASWAWDEGEELNKLEENFDESIQILWTGETTVAPVEQKTIDHFKELDNNGNERRDPLFWLNWPVNDVDMTRVFLGKADILEPGVKNLAGVVTNPMQEAQASKVSIFAIADYSWNTEDFDDQKSWEDSMKYIEPDATEAFHTLTKHMAHADPEVGWPADESEDIKDLLDETLNRLDNDEALGDTGSDLVDELQNIMDASDEFMANSKNEALKKELEPFINALHDMVEADVEYIKAQQEVESDNQKDAKKHYAAGQELREQSLDYDRPMLEGEDGVKAKPAGKRLQPFSNKLEKRVAMNVDGEGLSDIEGTWAEDFIMTSYENNWIHGFEDGTFKPNDSLSRMQSASLLVRMLDLEGQEEVPFTDIDGLADKTKDELGTAYANELIQGFEDDTFKPYKGISRAQMALMMARIYEAQTGEAYEPDNDEQAFSDIKGYDEETRSAIALLKELEIIKGYDDNKFNPEDATTRAQASKMLVKFNESI